MIARAPFRFLLEFAKLVRDETGQVLIIFTIMVPVILGVIGLSLEIGRYWLLNSQLQDLADAAALAGAKALDANNGAIARAKTAAETLNNDTWWSNVPLGGIQIDPNKYVFYSQLKCVPNCTISTQDITTTSDVTAAYIKVTTVLRGLTPTFLIAVGATLEKQTNATATAGSTLVACNVQPMMLCNPYEPNAFHATPGTMFHLKVLGSATPGPGGKSLAPGDFGLLDPPGQSNSGADTIRNLLSQEKTGVCYSDNVSPHTGEAVNKVSDGINVRFDMKVNGNTTGLDQTPAPDVIKGLVPKSCSNWNNPTDLGSSYRLPRDTTFPTTIGNLEIGDGNLQNPNTYWNVHYGIGNDWPSGLKIAGQANRYLAYRLELGLDGQTAPTNTGPETNVPVCTLPAAGPDRRILHVAIINCGAYGIKGNSVNYVRPNSYADFFITEPSTSGEVWTEFLQIVTPGTSNGTLHQIVQLYRDY